ncbi:hypothetical protein J6590_047919 [Homalodisca vitripennis]|nr:hypothetical protein J6590_047919 [Homalodisca vitripennis]
MSLKRKEVRGLMATVPPSLEGVGVGHRLRHHGKHHQGELWRVTTISDVINSTNIPTVDRPSVCYSTNEVGYHVPSCMLCLLLPLVARVIRYFLCLETINNSAQFKARLQHLLAMYKAYYSVNEFAASRWEI